ncbi:MAG: T9SS type A sorting domain-containing protein [bacterium]|nr:T9SS type A sorting domain-containing protein [bacterium]
MKYGSLSLTVLILLLISGIANANYLGDITLDRGHQAWLAHNDRVNVSFSYKVDDPAGARIMSLPYSNGTPNPNFGNSGSILYGEGEGTGDNWCLVTAGDWTVTHIQVTMWTADWNELLLEIFIPVRYHYSAKGITNITYSHSSPSWIQYGDELEIQHDITSDEAGYLFARPYYEGSLVSGYAASGGEHITSPNDTASHYFTMGAGPVAVDEIRFYLKSLDLTEVLWEIFVPVNYHWGEHGLSNFSFTLQSPQGLAYEEHVECSFDYTTSNPAGVRAWMIGARDGSPVFLDMDQQGSPLLPAPAGSISRWFCYLGDQDITHAYFIMANDDQTETHLSVEVPYQVQYRAHSVSQVALSPGAPAILDYGEPIKVDFAYYTWGTNRVQIWPYGYAQGLYVSPQGNAGSNAYSVPSGTGTNFFVYIGTDPVGVDQVLMRMRDAVTYDILVQTFYPAMHFYGPSATATAAPEVPPVAVTELLPNYPNPFNPVTKISFRLGEAGSVHLAVFDVRGRLVRELMNTYLEPGAHTVEWNGCDGDGNAVSSGVYFTKLMTAGEQQTRKMVLVK